MARTLRQYIPLSKHQGQGKFFGATSDYFAPAQMASQKKLAESRGKEVKEHGLGLVPLAGFELTIEERR
jgi:hypothetical protein